MYIYYILFTWFWRRRLAQQGAKEAGGERVLKRKSSRERVLKRKSAQDRRNQSKRALKTQEKEQEKEGRRKGLWT